MSEYIKMGHMIEVLKDSIQTQIHLYLPHHTVIRASSLTTRVRMVFDTSAKSTSGVSLNDALRYGPTVQQNLFSILVLEVWDLQRTVWRASPKDLLRSYQLTTVTYGTSPASFLYTYCLVALA